MTTREMRRNVTVVSAHQPNYLPWLGYFHKMTYSDVFVFLDDVQYTPKTYTTRCFIRQGQQKVRLSVPASLPRWDAAIREVRIDTATFASRHIESFRHAYGRCHAFDTVMEKLRPTYEVGETSLAEFNIRLITAIAEMIGLGPRFVRQSEFGIGSSKNQLLIDLTRAVDGDIFASGIGAKTYIEGSETAYVTAGARLAYQNFIHPTYCQRKSPFLDGCSILDLVFNHLADANEILTGQAEPPYLEWSGDA